MPAAVLLVVAASACSGAATVLQAREVRHEPEGDGLDAGLMVRLVRRPGYVLALALVAAGFALGLAALRTLPLFVVQAGRASSLAVAALLAVAMLGARLGGRDWLGVGAVVAGLVLLAAAATSGSAEPTSLVVRGALLLGVLLVAAAGAAATRIASRPLAGGVLGALAGLAFAALALGARTALDLAPAALVRDPAAWSVVLGGALGLLLGAMALQRTSVVGATAPMVATETVVGAALGITLAGDPAPAAAVPAVAGFVLVLVGALSLVRFSAQDGGREDETG